MLIKETAKAIAKAICSHLSPAGRTIVVRDSIPMQDLADNLPRQQLKELLFATARRLNLSSLRVSGQYGEIEGSPYDKVILRQYAMSGTWSPRFQTEIIDRAFRSHEGTFVDVGANIGLTAIPAATNHPAARFPHDRTLADGQRLAVGDTSLLAIETPGHARDHLVFVLEDERALFTGDVIIGHGTVVIAPPGGDMRIYQHTLARLRDEFGDARAIYGGHGAEIHDVRRKIDDYIAHRAAREAFYGLLWSRCERVAPDSGAHRKR